MIYGLGRSEELKRAAVGYAAFLAALADGKQSLEDLRKIHAGAETLLAVAM